MLSQCALCGSIQAQWSMQSRSQHEASTDFASLKAGRLFQKAAFVVKWHTTCYYMTEDRQVGGPSVLQATAECTGRGTLDALPL